MEKKSAAGWVEPTKAQIEDWKKEHDIRHIHVLKAFDPSDKKVKKAYMRSPAMGDLVRASQSNTAKPGTYNQSIYENCVLSAHPDIANDQELYKAMIFNVDQIMDKIDVEVEKL